jgi:peroxiredoxin/Flp pilus assembly protein TadD
MQGEAFNEGPRQKATLLKGMAKISFPVTSTNDQVQAFVEQGIGQLHAYWYFEAERSFRQAAKLDPNCAIAYWGMAMANINNEGRAKGFINEALKHLEDITPREKSYVIALADFYNADAKMKERDKTRRKNYVSALKRIADFNTSDLEAQAFLAHELLERFNRFEETIPYLPSAQAQEPPKDKSREAVAAVLDRFFTTIVQRDPLHPSHHYRIHLWDYVKAENALNSSAVCGPAEPGIAHMWHMPGHIYTRTKRYQDAAYQQEASARVDHAQMLRSRILPDQIHNYAHNNQWLVETYEFVGRVQDALTLAKNMIAIPRHPHYNNPETGSGSATMGRMRLFETLWNYDLWQEAIRLDKEGFLEPTSKPENQNERLKLLAVAGFMTGDTAQGERHLAELTARHTKSKEKDAKVGSTSDIESALNEVRAYRHIAQGERVKALPIVEKLSNTMGSARKARLYALAGDLTNAEKSARDGVEKNKSQVVPLATHAAVLWQAGKREEAKKTFMELRTLAGTADIETPLLAQLSALAREAGCSKDWRIAPTLPKDVGQRPALRSLGTLQWEPYSSPDFALQERSGAKLRLSDYRKQGKAVMVLFSLGAGCERCMEQLKAFAPLAKEFEQAGVALISVMPEERNALLKSKTLTDMNITFPLLSDRSLKSYKAFRAYDDFEEMPLHGAFLIDAQGRVRWQDISFQAFLDGKFALAEAKRLLTQGVLPPPVEKPVSSF